MKSPQSQFGPLAATNDPPRLGAQLFPPQPERPEPLLALLTSQHPLLSTAINGSLSAYTSSKLYSPRFKQGAEFVERHIGSPVVSTVGTAGRISGVENGMRWWLRRSSADDPNRSRKRRRNEKTGSDVSDVERGLRESSVHRHMQHRFSEMSMGESLPAYDDKRAPSYEEYQMWQAEEDENTNRNTNWQTRLMMSTSGLGVAMSEESLRSLKYCLSGVRWANSQLAEIIVSLQKVIERWSRSEEADPSEHNIGHDHDPPNQDPDVCAREISETERATILRHVQSLKADVMRIMKQVVGIISKYAGGGLPENARELVHKHLTSIPHRFRLATLANTYSSRDGEQNRDSETIISAKMVMVLAREGLDMMVQVSGVLNGTIVSAEEWCDRLGRRRAGTASGEPTAEEASPADQKKPIDSKSDVNMTGMDERLDTLASSKPDCEQSVDMDSENAQNPLIRIKEEKTG